MNDARQQMLERIGEDESLTGDLAGDAAEQLRQWANDTALAIVRRDDLDDETVQRQIRAVRTAARTAASRDGDITVAQHALAELIDAIFPAVVVSTPNPVVQEQQFIPDASSVTDAPPAHLSTPAPHPMWLRVRGWWRGMWGQAPKEE